MATGHVGIALAVGAKLERYLAMGCIVVRVNDWIITALARQSRGFGR